ncbi:MAG: sensor domain-containing diguanylate cyclase [Lachnospiraceae bacterium]|nr:sensor domain-containing diguanylate cyclase [Lachnospiraceae bacterium]
MEKIWEFYENLNEIVYTADMDSYELIYMNSKAREVYGYSSDSEFKGKKCYEVLQGCSCPCAICNNRSLRQGYFEEWQYYNPVLGKTYGLKDTMVMDEGKRFRMEIAIDMSIQEQQSKTIREFSDNEAMINEGLKIALSAPTPEESIKILLEYLGHALKSERVYIFEGTNQGIHNNTYEWCANDVEPQKDNLQNVAYEVVEPWYQRFRNNENVIIKELEAIRKIDPVVYEYLQPQNIRTLVVSPLVNDKKIIGFYGVDNPPGELLNHISTMFQIMGHFIVSLLRRRDLVKRLASLSYLDQLTGIGNRHAMNAYISEMRQENSIGILYCDVMGLKKVNDTQGHQAGDDLLLRACECLKRKYGDYSLFRIGGDEFLVLCAGIREEELLARAEALKQDMQENSALMALGCVWRSESIEDMDKLLSEADNKMYENKRRYYAGKMQ